MAHPLLYISTKQITKLKNHMTKEREKWQKKLKEVVWVMDHLIERVIRMILAIKVVLMQFWVARCGW